MLRAAFLIGCLPALLGADLRVSVLPPGVDQRTHDFIEVSLADLAAQQGEDGGWVQPMPGGSFAAGTYDVVTTSMIGLAFLAHGDTPGRGKYGDHLSKALSFVLRKVNPLTGCITSAGDEPRPMYGHCFAVLFLAELSGTEEHERTAVQVRKAIADGCRVIEKAQSSRGGWNYDWNGTTTARHSQVKDGVLKEWETDEPDDEGSVTIHAVQALRAAKNAGISVAKQVIDRGLSYLVMCQNRQGGIIYKYNPAGAFYGKAEPAISAAACTAFYMCGVYPSARTDTFSGLRGAAARCQAYVNRTFAMSLAPDDIQYYPFYTYLYLAQTKWFEGGNGWELHYAAMKAWLLDEKNKYRDPERPAWLGDTASGNRFYCTAAALLILQIPYKHLPILQK